MSSNFFSLPREIRDQIYELVLLHDESVGPWDAFYRQEVTLLPQVSRISKTLYRETSSLFYSRNRFDFTLGTPEEIASFLEQIGPANTHCIRDISINFPTFLSLKLDNIALEDDSLGILAKIQSACSNLRSLRTSLHSTNERELELDAADSPKIVTEALKLVNDQFKAICSIQEIIVEVYEDAPSHHVRKEMENQGWTINTSAYEEKDFSEGYERFDDDDFDSENYSGGSDDYGDEYDIDNDSDFWRRQDD